MARRRRDMPVPGALEGRQLRSGVEVLPPARLVPVRPVPVLDQHFLRRDREQHVRREGARVLNFLRALQTRYLLCSHLVIASTFASLSRRGLGEGKKTW